MGASLILLCAAPLDFEALKLGKISVVEPLFSLEIVVSTLLALYILKELPNTIQIVLIVTLMIGLCLVAIRNNHFQKKVWFEKGTYLAITAALTMSAANFFVSCGSRNSDTLITNWFLSLFLTIASTIYLLASGNFKDLIRNLKSNKKLLLGMSILDNIAWIAFAASMTLAPISIAVALSESYIIITVLLGLFINKEKLLTHQKIGLIVALISAITLALLTANN